MPTLLLLLLSCTTILSCSLPKLELSRLLMVVYCCWCYVQHWVLFWSPGSCMFRVSCMQLLVYVCVLLLALTCCCKCEIFRFSIFFFKCVIRQCCMQSFMVPHPGFGFGLLPSEKVIVLQFHFSFLLPQL